MTKRWILCGVGFCAVAMALLLPSFMRRFAPRAPGRDPYAGSQSCRECHESFYRKWETSHHGKAMQPVTPELAKTELTPLEAPIVISNRTYTVDLERLRVLETLPSGKIHAYPMLHTLGGKNIFYFLTLLEKGRLQVLPVAYNTRKKCWFNTTGSMVRHFIDAHDQALDWRDPMLTFNTACFGCHVSQLEKNYDPKSGAYQTVWREPGISCESCHGPSEVHNRVCRALPKGVAPTNLFLKSWRTFTPEQVNSACAPCHAKMHPLTTQFQPGDDFFDHYDIVCLEDRDFAADGRDLGENYTYTQWLMNPCVREGGLQCVRCHTSSGRYRFSPEATNDVNAACSACHADKARNLPAHSRHPLKGETGRCISCHMPTTSFAAMQRSDHSHRPPCPEAARRFGTTSACILCHAKEKEEWAAGHVRDWFPKSKWRAKMLREGDLVDAARKSQWEKLPDILTYLGEKEAEPVVCASLLRLLRNCTDARIGPGIRPSATHASPLVRSAAVSTLGNDLRSPASVAVICRALVDPKRVVRIQAAQAMAAYPRQALDPSTLAHLKRAEQELLEMFSARPDDWASHYNIGNYRSAQGDPKGAMAAYQASMKLRADTVMPYVNAAVLASQSGDLPAAIRYLQHAAQTSPEHGAVNLNLGLALAESGDVKQAEHHLRIAMKDPEAQAQAAYNCAVIVGTAQPKEAVRLCRIALERDPENTRCKEALQYYLRQSEKP